MKTTAKWVVRGVRVVGLCAAAALVAYVAVLPGLVERRAVGSLRALGLRGASLEVRAVSLRSAEVANVRLDRQGRARAGSLAVLYRLSSLLGGRVGTVEVTGAEVEMALRGGELDLGPLGAIETSGEAGELPFDRVDLRACALVLDLEGVPLRVPVRGSVFHVGDGAGAVARRAEVAGGTLHLTGNAGSEAQKTRLLLDGRLPSIAALMASLPLPQPAPEPGAPTLTVEPPSVVVRRPRREPRLNELPVRLRGQLELQAAFEREPGYEQLKARVALLRGSVAVAVAGHQVAAEGVTLSVEGGWQRRAEDDGGQWYTATAHLGAGRATAAGETVRDLSLLAWKDSGDALAFEASAEGESWKLAKLAGKAPGLFAWLRKRKGVQTASATWALEGTPPTSVAALAAARGIDIGRVGRVAATGQATVGLSERADGGWHWAISAPDVHVTVAPGDLALADGSALLRGAAADLRLRGDASAESLTVELLPGSRIALASATARVGDARMSLAGGAGPSAELAVGEQAATLSAMRGSEGPTWRLEAPDVRLTLRRGRAAVAGAAAEGIGLDARLRATAGPGAAECVLLAGSRASAASVATGGAGVRVSRRASAEPLLTATVGGEGVALSLSRQGDEASWTLAAPEVGVTLAAVDVALPAAGVAAQGVTATARLRASADPTRATLGLAAGSRLAVGAVSTRGTDFRVTKADESRPLVTVEVGDGGLAASASLAARPIDWRIAPSALRLALAEASVARVDGSLAVTGLRAAVPVRVRASRGEAALDAAGDWALGLGSLSARAGDETLRLGPTRLAVRGHEGQPVASAAFGGGELGFRLAARAATAGPVSVEAGEGTRATVASLRARAAASRDPEGTTVAVELVADGIEGTASRVVGDLALAGATQGSRLRVTVNGRGPMADLARLPFLADVHAAAGPSRVTVSGAFGQAEARVDSATVKGWAELERGRRPVVEGTVSLTGGLAQCREWKLLASGVSGEVPVRLNSSGRAVGRFAIEAVRYGRSRLPGLSGTVSVADWRVDADARWPVLAGAALEASGWVDVRSGVPLGRVRARLPRCAIEDEKELAGLLAEAQGIDLSGAFELDATVELLADRVLPRIALTVEDVTVGSKQYDVRVEGLRGTVVLDSFDPVSTPGHQRLEAARANVGGLQLQEGFVDFGVESPHSVFVERSEWGWAGGRLYTYALGFDPSKPIDLVVYGDKLKLAEILALIPEQRATGDGELYGRLPVTVRWPELRFGTGFLYATPGRQGRVRVKDAAALASGLGGAGAAGDRASIAAEIQRRFEAALTDFEYDVFRADFVREGEQLVARVLLRGRGPEMVAAVRRPTLWGRVLGAKPEPITLRQEFGGITFNIPYFDEILSKAIIVKEEFIPAAAGGASP